MNAHRSSGFSLVELLVVVAIIGILAAMYATTLSKAHDKAKQVVAAEGMRQANIGRLADDVNSPRRQRAATLDSATVRRHCRAAFRQDVGDEIYVSRPLYLVTNDAEFRAYWHTVLNPDNEAPIAFSGAHLVAKDEDRKAFTLQVIDGHLDSTTARNSKAPLAWEFLSTHLGEGNTGSIGARVLFIDGNVQQVKYPGQFPATRTVAELSHRFMQDFD